MNKKFINLLDKFTTDIRLSLNITKPPYDMISVIEILKGNLKVVESVDSDFSIHTKILKLPNNNNDKVFEILTLNERCNNFEITHTLGHLFLHMGYLVDDELWKKSSVFSDSHLRTGGTLIEREADVFANSFLMPKTELISLLRNGKSLQYIVKHFNVFHHHLIKRMTTLLLR